MTEKHEFGGIWTEEKLKRAEKYLKAFVTKCPSGPEDTETEGLVSF